MYTTRTKILTVSLSVFVSVGGQQSSAEVVLDGSMGQAGTISGPNYNIADSYGKISGNNLFHSFSTFNVGAGENAIFSGPQNIQNVFSRVTGDSYSAINGQITSNINGANLWFMNPNGIVFGKDARINVSGAFHATTADYIQFRNDDRFNASLGGDSLLSIAEPTTFGFIKERPVGIAANGATLNVESGREISLVGGPITLTNSKVVANGGRINIAAVGSPGTVKIVRGESASNSSLVANVAKTESVNLVDSYVGSDTINAGQIFIVGGQFYMSQNSVITNSFSSSAGNGIVSLNIGNGVIDGGLIKVTQNGQSDSANIAINANRLTIRNDTNAIDVERDAGIYSVSSEGATADIEIKVKENVELVKGTIASIAKDGGTAGTISIEAANVGLTNGSRIYSESDGNVGVKAISINAKNIAVHDRSEISTSNMGGDPVDIRLTATQTVSVSSNSTVGTHATSTGRGGDLVIESQSLLIADNSRLTTTASSTGNAGNITACGEGSLKIYNSRITSESLTSAGGNIRLGTDGVAIVNDSEIAAKILNTDAATKGGDVNIGRCHVNVQVEGAPTATPIGPPTLFISPKSKVEGTGTVNLLVKIEDEKPPQETEEKTLVVSAPLYVEQLPVSTTPCSRSVTKHRNSFIVQSQIPMHGTPADAFSSYRDTRIVSKSTGNNMISALTPITFGCGE